MAGKKAGITASRTKLFAAFRKEAPKEFRACCADEFWILSPCRAGFNQNGPNGHYFDAYIEEVWGRYAVEKPTPSGKWKGKVVNNTLTFTPVDGGYGVILACSRRAGLV
jgi:hypothetical protein